MTDAPNCPRHPARGPMKRSVDGEHWYCPKRLAKGVYCDETMELRAEDMTTDRVAKYAVAPPPPLFE